MRHQTSVSCCWSMRDLKGVGAIWPWNRIEISEVDTCICILRINGRLYLFSSRAQLNLALSIRYNGCAMKHTNWKEQAIIRHKYSPACCWAVKRTGVGYWIVRPGYLEYDQSKHVQGISMPHRLHVKGPQHGSWWLSVFFYLCLTFISENILIEFCITLIKNHVNKSTVGMLITSW